MRSLVASLIAEKNALASPSAWLPLITVEVTASEILRLVPNPTDIVFDGLTYVAFGCEIGELTQDAKGGLHELSISVSNVTREISAYIETHELRGRRVRIQYVNSANLGDPDAVVLDETYEIMSLHVKGSQFVTFTLGHDRISSHPFPAGRFLRDNCRWIYKSSECGYAGGLATCAKTLEGSNGCRAHANQSRFGGFPLLVSVPGRAL